MLVSAFDALEDAAQAIKATAQKVKATATVKVDDVKCIITCADDIIQLAEQLAIKGRQMKAAAEDLLGK